jgi:hypothetical protein
MQVMMPIMKQKIEATTRDVQQQVAKMLKESETRPGQAPPTSKKNWLSGQRH